MAKGCFVDDLLGEGCVFDGYEDMTVDDCDIALQLKRKGQGRDDCPYWQNIPITEKVTCPNCNHEFYLMEEE